MTLTISTRMNNIEEWIDRLISLYSLEDIFDEFDIQTDQALFILFQEGLIDPELLESLCGD